MLEPYCTLNDLATHEQEINSLAGKKTIVCLYTAEDDQTVTIDKVADTAVIYDQNGATSEADIVDYTFDFPATTYVSRIDCLNSGDVVASFVLSEARGEFILSTNRLTTGTLSSLITWDTVKIDRTWKDKVVLAISATEADIDDMLHQHVGSGYSSDTNLLETISNPEIFALSCQMKAMELIYSDMAQNGFNPNYKQKQEFYAGRYTKELSNAFSLIMTDTTTTRDYSNRSSIKVLR